MSFASYEAMPLGTMLARIRKYDPGEGYKMVEKAWHFAEKAHAGQNRKSGESEGYQYVIRRAISFTPAL